MSELTIRTGAILGHQRTIYERTPSGGQRVLASCPTEQDASRLVEALQAAQRQEGAGALRTSLAGMLESYDVLTTKIGLPETTLEVIRSVFIFEPERARKALAQPARGEDHGSELERLSRLLMNDSERIIMGMTRLDCINQIRGLMGLAPLPPEQRDQE